MPQDLSQYKLAKMYKAQDNSLDIFAHLQRHESFASKTKD